VAFVAALVLAFPARQEAHEVPGDVTVRAFVKAEGEVLRLVVRVPLEAMQDVNFPTSGPGFLDLAGATALLPDAAMLWLGQEVEIYEDGARLPYPDIAGIRLSIPSDRSFDEYETAVSHILDDPPLPLNTNLAWQQAMLDVILEYPVVSARSEFSILPSVERLGLRVTTVLRFVTPDGAERAFEFRGDPGIVTLDPRWHQAALRFVILGFEHILDGIDHLLFLACLVIPFRRFRSLVMIVTAFTVAHSVTLIASAYDFAPGALWFPPLVETVIAMSIVYMALENIVGASLGRRWLITFVFGLVHGFGFSFALRETLQFAGPHLLTSLLSFNIGVELGQLLVLALLIPALQLLFRFVLAERMGTIVLSAFIAHTSWHWMIERWGVLSQYPVTWGTIVMTLLTTIVPWLIGMLAAIGMLWWGMRTLGARGGSRATEAVAEE
jgi:hypothetical protein